MWSRIRTLIKNNLTGILGTIAFHLTLAVIFMLFRISANRSNLENIIYLDFGDEPVKEEVKVPGIQANAGVEQEVNELLAESRRNIPVNIATRMADEISTEKYLEKLEEDMNGSRPDEYYQQQERLRELNEKNEKAEMIVAPEKTDKDQESHPYEGLTTIYYSLENRYHLRLPLPVYKCEGAGEVTVTVAVDQKGKVIQAEIAGDAADVDELCFREAARTAALSSRFNADFSAPLRQKGTITYQFIAQ
jgi:hypothetical protein